VLGIGADPALSPDGKLIAYRRGRHIWLMNLFVAGPDDRSITGLTRPLVGSRDAYPAWRP
jgi:hypothetical protein